MFFFVLMILLILIIVPFTMVGYYHIKKLKAEAPKDYDYPQASDFRSSIIAAFIIATL